MPIEWLAAWAFVLSVFVILGSTVSPWTKWGRAIRIISFGGLLVSAVFWFAYFNEGKNLRDAFGVLGAISAMGAIWVLAMGHISRDYEPGGK